MKTIVLLLAPALAVLAACQTDENPLSEARQLSGPEIQQAFSDVRDDAEVQDSAGTTAINYWYADGRFRNEWRNGAESGVVIGRWGVEGDERCVLILSGIPEAEDTQKCGPVYQRGSDYLSLNPDGSIHGIHRLSPLPVFAETVYHSGRVYTVDTDNSWAEAFAIRDGHFVAVGGNEEVQALAGPETEVVDLAGRMVMPGIHDAHAHPVDVGHMQLFECSFPYSLSMPEILDEISACVATLEPGAWLRGGQWAVEMLETEQAPHRSALDAIAPDNPAFLMDSSVHAAWLNTRALELLGIDKDTPDPEGGVIVRDMESGEPSGVLIDEAAYAAMKQLPGYSVQQNEQALAQALGQMNAVGVTGVKDALVDASTLKAYSALASKQQLNMQIATSLSRSGWANAGDEDQASILEKRKSFESDQVVVDFVKIMLDGIPPTQTAAMLDPYLPDGVHVAGYRGELTQSVEQFSDDLVELDAAGLTVKVHATGDRAVRVVLDAVEKARKVNGDSGLQHEVSHAGMIHPDDLPRFKALNVVAELSPIIWYPSPLQDAMAAVLGPERAARFYQVRSLIDSGALLNYGSDWPAVVPSPSPWPGIEAMITRRDPYGESEAELNPAEAITLPEAIRIFTINGALTMGSAEKTGSIEVGKSANFIELDRNLFDIPAADISDTRVLRTVFKGQDVYRPDL